MKMKDKSVKQISGNKAHKQRLKEAKNRRLAPDFEVPPPFFAACKHHNINPEEWLTDVFNRIQEEWRKWRWWGEHIPAWP